MSDLIGLSSIINESVADNKEVAKYDEKLGTGNQRSDDEVFDDTLNDILGEIDDATEQHNTDTYASDGYMNNSTSTNNHIFTPQDRDLRSKTQEEEKKNKIDDVFSSMGLSPHGTAHGGSHGTAHGGNYDHGSTYDDDDDHSNNVVDSLEKEREEEEKSSMLAEIDEIKKDLEQRGEDLDRIPNVTSASSYREIDDILKILRHKINREKYATFAEEFIVMGATFIEELFDGKKTYFNRFAPDLTGWHREVQTRLRRSRYDTNKIVSGTIAAFDIPPIVRILIELIPSAFLYARNRGQKNKSSSEYNEQKMSNADNTLRDL